MNVCIFSGRLTRDAETRHTNSGTAVSSFTIAVDSGFGEHKRTDFIDCILWKREALAVHLTKGKPIMVSGELSLRKWQDKEGNNRISTEIICRDVDFQQGEGKRAENQQPAEVGLNDDDLIPF